jgi:hypothetical protein
MMSNVNSSILYNILDDINEENDINNENITFIKVKKRLYKVKSKPKPTSKENKKYKEDDEKNDIKFSNKEIQKYEIQKNKCKFMNVEEEYEWSKTQFKKCSKCKITKKLIEFNGNTSGTDSFDCDGYRLRRPECKECQKNINIGKRESIKIAKSMNIPYKPPKESLCSICNKPGIKGDELVFDHDHTTLMFRGYCHNSCNRALGVLGDNVEGLLRAINYLNKNNNYKIIQDKNGMLLTI